MTELKLHAATLGSDFSAVVEGAPLEPCARCSRPVITARTRRSASVVLEVVDRAGIPPNNVFVLFHDGRSRHWFASSLARGHATAMIADRGGVRVLFTPHRCSRV